MKGKNIRYTAIGAILATTLVAGNALAYCSVVVTGGGNYAEEKTYRYSGLSIEYLTDSGYLRLRQANGFRMINIKNARNVRIGPTCKITTKEQGALQ